MTPDQRAAEHGVAENRVHEAGELGVRGDGGGVHEREHLSEFASREAPVNKGRRRAGAKHGERLHEEVRAVLRHDGDDVAGTDAELRPAAGPPFELGAEFGVGVRVSPVVGQGRHVRVHGGAPLEHVYPALHWPRPFPAARIVADVSPAGQTLA